MGLSFIVLILVFRSILVPLVASAGFLFSILASFGAVVAVYQMGFMGSLFGVHDPGPILAFLPTLMIGILFGLAMDYQCSWSLACAKPMCTVRMRKPPLSPGTTMRCVW